MFSRIKVVVLFMVAFIPMLSSALERDNTESYMDMEIQPLCTLDGQVKVVFTNVSPSTLLVDPSYGTPDLFDAPKQLIHLSIADSWESVQLWRLKTPPTGSDLVALLSGQSVEHIVDFTAHNPSIDKSLRYVVSNGINFNVLTDQGKKIRLGFYSPFLNNELIIESECFK